MAKFRLSAFSDEADSFLSGQIEACMRNGIEQVEIRGVNGKPFVDHTLEEAEMVRKQLADHGMSVSALGSPFGKISITDPFAPHLEHFRRAMALCHQVETARIRIFSFFIPTGEDPAQHRNEVIDRMSVMLEVAQAEGIQCAHENEKAIYGDNAERCLDLLQVFQGKLGGIFDPANFIQCGVAPQAACAALRKQIHWMHIKDACVGTGQVVPAGQGDGHLREVISVLSATVDREMTLTLEPHLAVFQGLTHLERAGNETKIPAFTYQDNREAFDAAANALRQLLGEMGYQEINEGGKRIWTK